MSAECTRSINGVNTDISILVFMQELSCDNFRLLTMNLIFCTTDTGKKTREYITLLKNLSSLVKHLRTLSSVSKEQLCLTLMENEWISTTEDPSEKELVLLALNRVEKDSRAFHKFVSLLSEIGGLKEVAKELMTKLKSADFN